ncbi:hypothetical protein FSP39_013136 [Pinctada imbricata]|uniref:Small ribosomal subunit protein mS31 n=1 Tax=Pinctada imbricata TaxID=66713 RepID=A0AA88Y511_PINIB|nr:hypothetical protein FSP39_013136 [Pinctada imbricata]
MALDTNIRIFKSVARGNEMKKAVKDVASNFGKNKKNVEADLTEQVGKMRKTAPVTDHRESMDVMQVYRKKHPKVVHQDNFEVPDNGLLQKMEDEPIGKAFLMESLGSIKVDTQEARPYEFKKKKINFFGETPLGIFSQGKQKLNKEADNTFHEKLEAESVTKFQTNLFPLSGFPEMIQDTLDGKLWRFPIDNEQGWESEQNVPFHEHIFLDDAIEDFPKQGPIRNFMELVITGLSKNPYLTVEEKREHIDWYRKYFKQPEKQAVLKESLGDRAKFTELQ